MLYINNPFTNVYFNLAAEEYMLKNFKENVLMVWQNEPAVVIGKHQNVYTEVNMNYVEKNNIKVARRYSGGGAVYHDPGNLNITFIETARDPVFDHYLDKIAAMLLNLGLKVAVNERRSIFLSGRKVSGSAQCVYKDRVLFHASLLFDSDLEKLSESLYGGYQFSLNNKGSLTVRSVKSPVRNIRSYLPESKNINDFKEYVVSYFLQQEPDRKPYQWNNKDFGYINALSENKYETNNWNMGVPS